MSTAAASPARRPPGRPRRSGRAGRCSPSTTTSGMPPTARRPRGPAGHRLKVHDAERLVDRRADEDGRVRRAPAEVAPAAASPGPRPRRRARLQATEGAWNSAPISGVSGDPAQQHHLHVRVEALARPGPGGRTPFCRVIRPTNRVRPGRVDAEPSTASVAGSGAYSVGVDAVVDHVHLVRVEDRVAVQDVGAHALADRDHRVGALERRPLGPGRQAVAAAELLGLPRPLRLEGVRGDDVRDVVQQPVR